MAHKLTLPLNDENVLAMHIGDEVLLSGTLLTARDAAHKWLLETFIENLQATTHLMTRPSTTPSPPSSITAPSTTAAPSSQEKLHAMAVQITSDSSLPDQPPASVKKYTNPGSWNTSTFQPSLAKAVWAQTPLLPASRDLLSTCMPSAAPAPSSLRPCNE